MNFKNRFQIKYRVSPHAYGNQPIEGLSEVIKYVSGKKVLDLGIGNGRNTSYLLEKGFKITGVDNSSEGLDILKKRFENNPNLILIDEDVLEYKFENDYDLILSIGLMHFLELKDIQYLFKQIQINTKIGGINFVIVKMSQNKMGDLPHVFKKNELKQFYSMQDWKVLEYRESKEEYKTVASIIAKRVS